MVSPISKSLADPGGFIEGIFVLVVGSLIYSSYQEKSFKGFRFIETRTKRNFALLNLKFRSFKEASITESETF